MPTAPASKGLGIFAKKKPELRTGFSSVLKYPGGNLFAARKGIGGSAPPNRPAGPNRNARKARSARFQKGLGVHLGGDIFGDVEIRRNSLNIVVFFQRIHQLDQLGRRFQIDIGPGLGFPDQF